MFAVRRMKRSISWLLRELCFFELGIVLAKRFETSGDV